MSRRANPKLIGGFIVGALALMVAAAMVFGTFTLFQDTRRLVVFFEGTVDGLTVGSPVLFRGVPIGKVTQVTIRYDPDQNELAIPVIIEINPGVIERWTPERGPFNTSKYRRLLDKGLRARLESVSFVTGQKAVQLDFFPATPIVFHKSDINLKEIPAVPSQVRELMSSAELAAKDLPGLIKSATGILDRAQALLSEDNQRVITKTLHHVASLSATLQRDAEALEKTIGTADKLLGSFVDLTGNVNGIVMDNRPDLRQLVRGLHSDITAAGRLLDQANRVVGDARQPLQRFTEASLTDLAALIIDARNSVNQISHVLGELDRHPARYLLGNKAGEGLPLK